MRERLALALNRLMSVRSGTSGSVLTLPGAHECVRVVDATGYEVSVISRGDVLDVYHGRKDVVLFAFEGRAMLRLSLWVFWQWWVFGTWCGLKYVVWGWTMRVLVNAEQERSRARWHPAQKG